MGSRHGGKNAGAHSKSTVGRSVQCPCGRKDVESGAWTGSDDSAAASSRHQLKKSQKDFPIESLTRQLFHISINFQKLSALEPC